MAQEGSTTTPDLRPLGVGEILDVSIKVYTRNLWTFIGIIAVVVVPIGILTMLGYMSIIPDGARITDDAIEFPTQGQADTYTRFALATIGLQFLATLIATGAGTKAVADAYLGRKPRISESFAYVGRRFHSLIWLAFLQAVVFFLGLIALVIPGIYLGVALSVAVPALVIEGIKGTKALSRSFNLVKGRWWPTFGTLLLGLFLIPFVINFALGFLLGLGFGLQDIDSVTSRLVLSELFNVIGLVITTPIQVAVITILYFDLRVRKEGFDLQLLTERIQGPPGLDAARQPQIAGPSTPPSSGPPPPASS